MTQPLLHPNVPVIACSHCGEACEESTLLGNQYSFCCQGCKMVFEILQENDLCQYYSIEKNPGLSLKKFQHKKYDYLDDPIVKKQFLDFANDEISKVTFRVPQIHCASCIWLLENLHQLQEGILQGRVNFLKKEIYITFKESEVQLSEIASLLQNIGYQPLINLADLKNQETPSMSKALWYKLGLTGFICGNIMLLSFPEYLGLDKALHPAYHKIFGYLNLILSLPLVFYSGSDYLRSAFWGLRQRQINIDVPIAIGMLSLFIRSIYEILSQTGAGYLDSLAGLIFFLLIGKWFQQKTYYQISFERDYQSYFPIAAHRLEDKVEKAVAINQLETGDVILIRNQELIPADGILADGEAFIDYSFVTGESKPVRVEQKDTIFAGGRQVGGLIQLELTKAVNQSYLVQLWNEQSFQQKDKHQEASQLANTIGRYFTVAILLIAGLTLAYWLPKDLGIAINAFSAVLIIACPCAVALSIPFTYGNVLRLLAKRGIYLKNTGVVENIQQITHIVFDKTGTLTQRQEHLFFTGEITAAEKAMAKSLAHQSAHPRSQQIFKLYQDQAILPLSEFKEIKGEGISAKINGQHIYIGKPKEADTSQVESTTALFIDGTFKGLFCHQPVLREGLTDSFAWLNQFFQLRLLSGDQDRHRAYFDDFFSKGEQMKFDQSPQDKLDYIKKLQEEGAVVMMVGDGLNDAGALKQANVGLVLSEDHNNFTPACDGVLSPEAFRDFPKWIAYLQKSRKIIYGSYIFALCYNLIGLSFAVQGLLSPIIAAILMPLSSVSIVVFGVGWSQLMIKKKMDK